MRKAYIVTEPLKKGDLLFHPDTGKPLGVVARDRQPNDVLSYDPDHNTEDVIVKGIATVTDEILPDYMRY